MKVKLLTNLGSNDFPGHPFKDGEEHKVTDELGAKLVRLKLAVEILPPPPPPPPPEPKPVKAEPVRTEPAKEIESAPKADKFTELRAKHQPPQNKPATHK